MAEEVNHRNKRARLILNNEVNHEDSEHTFCLDLPPYSEKEKFLKFIDDNGKGWPSVSFSFTDGNFAGIDNLFKLSLDYEEVEEEDNEKRLNVFMEVDLKFVPWKVNENLAPIILNFARISFVNKLDGPSSDANPHVVLFDTFVEHVGDYSGGLEESSFLNWDSNYSGIKITINVSKRAEGSVEIVPSNPMLPSKVVNTSFSEYFLSEDLSDCKVEAGGKTFPAHRFVLVEISGFFKRMFSTDMMENRNRVWKIDDFEPEVVEEFLEFAYKGTSKNLALARNTEIIMDLFRMGHRYDVVLLKTQCEELLKNLIDSQNVVNLFHFGFLYDTESLMSAAKVYFTRFKLQIIPDFVVFHDDFLKKYPAIILYKLTIE